MKNISPLLFKGGGGAKSRGGYSRRRNLNQAVPHTYLCAFASLRRSFFTSVVLRSSPFKGEARRGMGNSPRQGARETPLSSVIFSAAQIQRVPD